MAKATKSLQYIAALAAALNFASRIDDHRHVGGDVQFAFFDIEVTADNVATDVIDLWEFPVGTIIYPELCQAIVSDDMSSGAVTLDIGDAVDPDRYCDGLNAAAVTNPGVNFLTPAFPDGFANRHKMVNTGVAATTTTLLKLTFATLGATVEAGKIRLVIAYKTLAL